jgi:pyoverdine/dityrosine biosynthesis protein Dit1
MNDAVALEFSTQSRVVFRSLIQLLQLKPSDHSHLALGRPSKTPRNFFATEVDGQAELSRQILLHGFRPDAALLRGQITAGDATALATYRGFSRFLLEDLENNRYTAGMSRTRLRKLSSKIAIEMIEVRAALLSS